MDYLTAEKIAELTDHKDGIANIRAINTLYRAQDESHLWPVRGRFNVTERAIRKARPELPVSCPIAWIPTSFTVIEALLLLVK